LDALPLHDVRDLGAGEYESTGRDPQLELRVQARRWPVGWVNLEFEVQVHEMEHEQRAVRPVLSIPARAMTRAARSRCPTRSEA
jgi:hypothetical protein